MTSSTLVNNVATSGRGSVSDWTLTPPGAVSVVGESAQDITSKGGACAYCTACTLSGNTGGTRADFTTLASYLAATVPSPTSSARRLGALPRTSVDTGVASDTASSSDKETLAPVKTNDSDRRKVRRERPTNRILSTA